MNKFIILFILFIPLTVSAQERNLDRNSEIKVRDSNKPVSNSINSSSDFTGLGFSPDYVNFIYKLESQTNEVRQSINEGRGNNRNNNRNLTAGGEGYYYLNLLNLRTQRVSFFNDREFIQWDSNGLYAFRNGQLLISRDGGRRWHMLLDGLYGAIDIRIAPNGRIVAYTIENNFKDRRGLALKALMLAVLDDFDFPLINVLEIAQHVPRSELPYTPKVEQGVNSDFLFTADSRTLYFTNKRNNNTNSIQEDIFKYDIWTKKASCLTAARNGFDGKLQLSPDGSKLAWITSFSDQPVHPEYHLMVLDLVYNKLLNTTIKVKHKVIGPYIWGEKPNRLYYISDTHLGESIFSLDIAPRFTGAQVNILAQSKTGSFTRLFGAYDKTVLAEHFNTTENRMEFVRISSQNGLMDIINSYSAKR